MSEELPDRGDLILSPICVAAIGSLIGMVLVAVISAQDDNNPPTVYTGVVKGVVFDHSANAVLIQIGSHAVTCSLDREPIQMQYQLPYNMTSLVVGSNVTIVQTHAGNCVRA